MPRKNFTKPWIKILNNWDRLTSPGLPSPKEVKIFKKFLSPILRKKRPKILILGATPELRDLIAAVKNIETTVLDINLYMILAMTKLLKKKPKNEIYINASWFEAPLKKNYYDAAVGDFVIPNVMKKDLNTFLANVKKWLKPKAYFITRVNVYSSNDQFVTLDEAIARYARPPITQWKINFFSQVGNFNASPMKANREFKIINFRNQLKKYYKNGKYIHPDPVVNKFLSKAHNLMPRDKVWTGYWRDELEKLFSKYFIIKKVDIHKKDWLDEDPIYMLQKK